MKKIILVFLMLPVFSFAQFEDSYLKLTDDTFEAEKVIQTDLSISDAKNKVKLWMGEKFVNTEEVLTNETDNALFGRFISDYRIGATTIPFEHKLKVYLKDQRLKIVIEKVVNADNTNWTIEKYVLKNNGKIRGMYKKMFTDFRENTTEIIDSLENSLKNNDEMEGW